MFDKMPSKSRRLGMEPSTSRQKGVRTSIFLMNEKFLNPPSCGGKDM